MSPGVTILQISDESIANIDRLKRYFADAEDAQKKLLGFWDYMMTCENTSANIPGDVVNDVRDSMGSHRGQVHPRSTYHSSLKMNDEFSYNNDSAPAAYTELVDKCQRHKDNRDYCMRNGTCRFNYPRNVSPVSSIRVIDVLKEQGEKRGTIR